MAKFETPGVFIEEVTGPGVIAGVGTSTAAFIGPALRGPFEPRRITSFDDFLNLYAVLRPNGTLDPHIVSPRRFFMAHAVQGFFENGGQQAFILRVGTGNNTTWQVKNQATPDADVVFRLEALAEGKAGNGITVSLAASSITGSAGVPAFRGRAQVDAINLTGTKVTLTPGSNPFLVGDFVTKETAKLDTGRARVVEIVGQELSLDRAIAGLVVGNFLRIANFDRGEQSTLRLASREKIFPGMVVTITGRNADDTADESEQAIIERVDTAGFVTFSANPSSTKIFCLAATEPPKLVSHEFNLGINDEAFTNLSLHLLHPRNVFNIVDSKLVRVLRPEKPPNGTGVGALLVSTTPVIIEGKNDDPGSLLTDAFTEGLKTLAKIDDVNLVCIPDGANREDWESIQDAMILHCETLKDRFAILDARPRLEPLEVEIQRQKLDSERGFGALYYPWLEVRDPSSTTVPPGTIFIPPCGHLAGIFARTDQERGVHKAPANTDVRGVLGLERVLSDGQQGPLNIKGINVLRIFPGSATVVVWGARTIVNPIISDWLYVNVRRLVLFIEESIEEGIRFAVFEPNAPPLWKALKRTLDQFLNQVWRSGALFGDTPDQAFRVRIDEGLNPPAERARGRLFIEIRVAPVRPAEFIVVRIGLFDGGADVQEA